MTKVKKKILSSTIREVFKKILIITVACMHTQQHAHTETCYSTLLYCYNYTILLYYCCQHIYLMMTICIRGWSYIICHMLSNDQFWGGPDPPPSPLWSKIVFWSTSPRPFPLFDHAIYGWNGMWKLDGSKFEQKRNILIEINSNRKGK